MAKGLSRPQIEALKALPFSMTYWGGRPFHSWPGRFTETTVQNLVARGLMNQRRGQCLDTNYTITEAGRDALAQIEK